MPLRVVVSIQMKKNKNKPTIYKVPEENPSIHSVSSNLILIIA